MQSLLAQHRDSPLRAYFVWGPFIRTDNEASARPMSERYSAPNSVHFWTPTTKLAQQLASVLGMAAGHLAWDVFLLYPRGTLWDLNVPKPLYWQHQLGIIQGDPFHVQVLEGRLAETLRRN